MTIVQYKLNTYKYFKKIKPSIDNGTVLDYGCNYGVFLDSSKSQFNEKSYTGIDVDKEAIIEGKRLYPNANFIWYNGYNPVYNPYGTSSLPSLSQKYDTVISYSVFTHTSKEDMLDKIDWLYGNLNDGGTILATWLDIDSKIPVNFFERKRIKDFGSCDPISAVDYVYLNDNRTSKSIEQDISFLLAFYKKDYLQDLLSDYKVTLVDAFPEIPECFQSCIVIEKS